MRLFVMSVLGLGLASCGLSMNPDLPSAEEGGGSPFSDGTGDTSSDADGGLEGGAIVIGAPNSGSDGLGGSQNTCPAKAGAGGMAADCEGSL